MFIRRAFTSALRGLNTHRTRSALTMLGIVIGVTAIILIVSLGEGAQALILGEVQSIGAKVIAIVPGREPKGPSDFLSTFTDSLKQKDLDALSRSTNVPHLGKIMPIVFGSYSVSYGSETYRPTIYGATPLFGEIYDVHPKTGRLFSDDEVRGYADTAVIGSKVVEELFGNEEALGKRVKIKEKSFRVVGVLETTGQSFFLNFDSAVIVPYTTAQQYLFGIKYFNRIVIEADTEDHVAETIEDVNTTLRASHNITDPEKDDFFLETQADAMKTVSTITDVLTLFLAAVAAISLIVGGVGIMNIMLVSVTERTREIGLRKAVGAKGSDIMLQFLLEAVILTVAGGLVGVALGAFFSFAISLILGRTLAVDWEFVFPVGAAFLGIGVAAAVGLVFGLYPARVASKKSPIEALRYE
ncbi:MAG: ABC transporter permease [Candidatus Brennerbacteria bacterium]|nr:ABC transporter permease [Candidatus Brennerbacteria bacterium]